MSIDINIIIAFIDRYEMRIANILDTSIILRARALFLCFHRIFRNPGHRSRSNLLSLMEFLYITLLRKRSALLPKQYHSNHHHRRGDDFKSCCVDD